MAGRHACPFWQAGWPGKLQKGGPEHFGLIKGGAEGFFHVFAGRTGGVRIIFGESCTPLLAHLTKRKFQT